jgi:YidC/Oxa1 family membrane protein insertase
VPGHDLGIAIILLTILIKLILLPLSKKSLKSQKALQDLQPKIEEIKKKYANKKEVMGKAIMQLYRDNKVNPFSSCLPLIIQLPFLIAVFRVFRDGFNDGSMNLIYSFVSRPESINSISFGFLDLSQRSIPLALMAGLAQFWQSKMLMAKKPAVKSSKAKDENMMAMMNKQMLYFMPLLTVFIASSFPAGLALYWLVTTLLTVLQQMYLFKKQEQPINPNKGQKNKVVEGEIVK